MNKNFSEFILVVIVIYLSSWGCVSTKTCQKLVKFESTSFTSIGDSIIKDYGDASFINYYNYFIEFNTAPNFETIIYEDSIEKVQTKIDTLSIYVIDFAANQFFEFDTFAINSKLIQSGKLTSKPSGFNFGIVQNDSKNNDYDLTKIRDTIINTQNLFYLKELYTTSGKLIENTLFLSTDTCITTILECLFGKFPDRKYSIYGLQQNAKGSKEKLNFMLKNVQPLSEEDIKICKNYSIMIKQTKK